MELRDSSLVTGAGSNRSQAGNTEVICAQTVRGLLASPFFGDGDVDLATVGPARDSVSQNLLQRHGARGM